jgi:hypothetical protein
MCHPATLYIMTHEDSSAQEGEARMRAAARDGAQETKRETGLPRTPRNNKSLRPQTPSVF